MRDLPDGELASIGTREAFEILFHRHRTPVFHFIARQVTDRALAEDLFQTVFLKAFRSLSTFRGASEFRTWLFSIAVHQIADERRRGKSTVALTETFPAPQARGPESNEIGDLVRRAIEELPEKHRQLFLLVRYHKVRIAEAAEALGLTPGSAKVTLFRIQTRIGSQLKTLGALL
ncbi:MAG TPA: RNA polymerase sigma factor [Planctomycetota bacterium]|nr:RNA polymerase sigma factor [Planctomycetota bacterium]